MRAQLRPFQLLWLGRQHAQFQRQSPPAPFPLARPTLSRQTQALLQLSRSCSLHLLAACCGHMTHSQAYFSQDRSIDAFTYLNPASLVIFSAGNNGENGFGTVTKSCKNCLMTGATQQSDALFRSMEPYVDPGWFCPVFRPANSSSTAACCRDPLSCVSQCCNYIDSANMSLACCAAQTNCGSGECSVESGNLRSPTNIASFSSLGPTSDGRFKPDLVVPGEDTLSAATPVQTNTSVAFIETKPNHCIVPDKFKARSPEDNRNNALRTLSGTSMSAPLLAGVAEKIRQYFVQGCARLHRAMIYCNILSQILSPWLPRIWPPVQS